MNKKKVRGLISSIAIVLIVAIGAITVITLLNKIPQRRINQAPAQEVIRLISEEK